MCGDIAESSVNLSNHPEYTDYDGLLEGLLCWEPEEFRGCVDTDSTFRKLPPSLADAKAVSNEGV